jgi:Septum formation
MRVTSAIAVIAAAGAMLTGCTLASGGTFAETREPLHSSAGASPVDAGKPSAGQCWRATYDGAIQYADWNPVDNGGPVSCSKTHQLYTFAVLPLALQHSGEEFNSSDVLVSAISSDADATCQNYLDERVGRVDNQNGRFQLKAFVPLRAEWQKGARWVRCDLNVFKIGSRLSDPTLEDLPSFATVKGELTSDPGQFDLCSSVAGGTVVDGPRATGAVFASCTGNPQWQMLRYAHMPGAASGAAYPTPAAWASAFQELCAPLAGAGQVAVPIYPTKTQWAGGTYAFECWAARA